MLHAIIHNVCTVVLLLNCYSIVIICLCVNSNVFSEFIGKTCCLKLKFLQNTIQVNFKDFKMLTVDQTYFVDYAF